MTLRTEDTIAALATPAGEGALAVIRISGPGAIAVADSVFRGGAPLARAGPERHFQGDGLERSVARRGAKTALEGIRGHRVFVLFGQRRAGLYDG